MGVRLKSNVTSLSAMWAEVKSSNGGWSKSIAEARTTSITPIYGCNRKCECRVLSILSIFLGANKDGNSLAVFSGAGIVG